jgi:G3E family GTPase
MDDADARIPVTLITGFLGAGKADEQACMVHVRRKFFDEAERTRCLSNKLSADFMRRL